jgi:hypothetical protein
LSEIIRLEPNPANKCFGCGGDNSGGMKLTFEQDNTNRKIVVCVGRTVSGRRRIRAWRSHCDVAR